jgi:hypothetical protein
VWFNTASNDTFRLESEEEKKEGSNLASDAFDPYKLTQKFEVVDCEQLIKSNNTTHKL